MNAEQIRVEAIEVLAQARFARGRTPFGNPEWDSTPVYARLWRSYRQAAAADVDALAAAGLLPTESRWKTSGAGGDSPGWRPSKADAVADWDRVQEKCAEMYPDWEYEAPILKREYATGWREVAE